MSCVIHVSMSVPIRRDTAPLAALELPSAHRRRLPPRRTLLPTPPPSDSPNSHQPQAFQPHAPPCRHLGRPRCTHTGSRGHTRCLTASRVEKGTGPSRDAYMLFYVVPIYDRDTGHTEHLNAGKCYPQKTVKVTWWLME
eukprot:1127253-Prorocentrum_minimum.AAC.3